VIDDLVDVLDELPGHLVVGTSATAACGPTPTRSSNCRSAA
jgi:hypothetical protein